MDESRRENCKARSATGRREIGAREVRGHCFISIGKELAVADGWHPLGGAIVFLLWLTGGVACANHRLIAVKPPACFFTTKDPALRSERRDGKVQLVNARSVFLQQQIRPAMPHQPADPALGNKAQTAFVNGF